VRADCRFLFFHWLAKRRFMYKFSGMSMAEVMREVADWPRVRQNKLAAFLLHLRLREDPVWRTEMTRRIDDRNPKNWVRLEDLDKSPKRRARK
jgi:hypothetical protein